MHLETTPPLISIEPQVRKALAEGLPVVALESTIISHGMPYPDNLAMARCGWSCWEDTVKVNVLLLSCLVNFVRRLLIGQLSLCSVTCASFWTRESGQC